MPWKRVEFSTRDWLCSSQALSNGSLLIAIEPSCVLTLFIAFFSPIQPRSSHTLWHGLLPFVIYLIITSALSSQVIVNPLVSWDLLFFTWLHLPLRNFLLSHSSFYGPQAWLGSPQIYLPLVILDCFCLDCSQSY